MKSKPETDYSSSKIAKLKKKHDTGKSAKESENKQSDGEADDLLEVNLDEILENKIVLKSKGKHKHLNK